MKKLTIFFLTIFLTTINIGCQDSKKTKETEKTIDMINTDLIKNVLQNQLKHGISGEIFETDISTYKYSKIDLDAIIDLLQDELKNSGYQFSSNDLFNAKIRKVFNRILLDTTSTKYVYVNFNDKCDKQIKFYRNDNSIDLTPFSLYIIKRKNFITQLYAIPEVVDYLKESAEISKIEDSVTTLPYENNEVIKILKWKDVPNLAQQRNTHIQTLVHRNKYLFNDNKGSLAWLKSNDEYFLESLVTTFGYTEDKDLLDWVMLKNRSKAREFIKNNVFVRNCKGELEIREDILKYIEQTTNEKEHVYFEELPRLYYDTTNNDFWDQFNEKESYKILAYLANTYDYLFMKYQNVRKNQRWNILGSIFYYSAEGEGEKWKKIEENFKANNYYNLPHLKEVLSYAHEFESVGAPD